MNKWIEIGTNCWDYQKILERQKQFTIINNNMRRLQQPNNNQNLDIDHLVLAETNFSKIQKNDTNQTIYDIEFEDYRLQTEEMNNQHIDNVLVSNNSIDMSNDNRSSVVTNPMASLLEDKVCRPLVQPLDIRPVGSLLKTERLSLSVEKNCSIKKNNTIIKESSMVKLNTDRLFIQNNKNKRTREEYEKQEEIKKENKKIRSVEQELQSKAIDIKMCDLIGQKTFSKKISTIIEEKLESISNRVQIQKKKRFNIVIDIDGVCLVGGIVVNNNNKEDVSRFRKTSSYFKYLHKKKIILFTYNDIEYVTVLTHGFLELLYFIWMHEEVATISFFSAGLHERNVAIVDKLFSLMPENVRKREDIIVKSRKHMIPYSNTFIKQFMDEEMVLKKDLSYNFPEFNIENTILIDDLKSNSQFGEHFNLLESPNNDINFYYNYCKKSLNSSFYICACLDILIRNCQHPQDRLIDYMVEFQNDFYIHEPFIHYGLKIMKKINPNIDLLTKSNMAIQASLPFIPNSI